MVPGSLGEALNRAQGRNAGLRDFYRDLARRSSQRSVAGLAATAAEQRDSLAEELSRLVAEAVRPENQTRVDLPVEAATAAPPKETGGDPVETLSWIRDAERQDEGFFNTLASAALDRDLSQRLASIAEQAKKRADLARDHLDLLSLR
jgi:rubrerythrin